ncbi:DUF2867 domain-containing protein [Nocardia sp. NPDC058633]|uniref:DUF2867 domain-containing protein n=1 Tax=Nocardia sp. NPDC058633 TaxID=3346568 RepID=UPI0036546BC1
MRLPIEAHTAQPWRIHEIAPDFRVVDVWSYRTPGAGPDDLAVMLAAIREAEGSEPDPAIVGFLFAVRNKLGEWLGWDGPEAGSRDTTLCDRLPNDLRRPDSGAPVPNLPFTMLYQLRDEHAMELVNKTVAAVAHFSWAPVDDAGYELRMAVLVKPNGLFGRAYMAAIAPFRYLIVYPALTRRWERVWRERESLLAPRE